LKVSLENWYESVVGAKTIRVSRYSHRVETAPQGLSSAATFAREQEKDLIFLKITYSELFMIILKAELQASRMV
jgi:hypothetical protein